MNLHPGMGSNRVTVTKLRQLLMIWNQGDDSQCYGNSDALNAAQMLFGMPFGRAVWEGEIRAGTIQRIEN